MIDNGRVVRYLSQYRREPDRDPAGSFESTALEGERANAALALFLGLELSPLTQAAYALVTGVRNWRSAILANSVRIWQRHLYEG